MTPSRDHDAVKISVLKGALKRFILPLLSNHMQNANFGIQMLRISFQMIPTGLLRDQMLAKMCSETLQIACETTPSGLLGDVLLSTGGLKCYVLPAK